MREKDKMVPDRAIVKAEAWDRLAASLQEMADELNRFRVVYCTFGNPHEGMAD